MMRSIRLFAALALLLLPQLAHGQAVTDSVANAAGGTTVNALAKLTGTGLVTAGTSDTYVQGVVTNGAGTTGSAALARVGQANLLMDAATTYGDWVTISSTNAGYGHDFGSSSPPCGVQVIGRVLATVATPGTTPVLIDVLTGTVAAGAVPYGKACGGTGATTGSGASANLSMAYLGCVPTLSAVTGTTSETIIGVCQIPANLIGTRGVIKVTGYAQLSPLNTNSKTVKFRISSTNSVSGTQCTTQTATVSTISGIIVGGVVIAGGATNVQDCISYNGASSNLTNGGGTAASDNPTTIDTTVPWYVIMTGTLANTGDTLTGAGLWAEFLPPGGN